MEQVIAYRTGDGLDRTYEELKQQWNDVPDKIMKSLDRTYEELKHAGHGPETPGKRRFGSYL